jgi:hypothetical protein
MEKNFLKNQKHQVNAYIKDKTYLLKKFSPKFRDNKKEKEFIQFRR